MFEKRLLGLCGSVRQRTKVAALIQWVGLLMGVIITCAAARLIECLLIGTADLQTLLETLTVCAFAAGLRVFFSTFAIKLAFKATREVKMQLRSALFNKLTNLGAQYCDIATTAEITQITSEGIDQLEAYFARYLPQFIFSLVAPCTLCMILLPLYPPVALVLLGCAPLIPLLLFAQNKMVMRVTRRQWNAYTLLGDRFLENLQAMTTLKVYGADRAKQDEMAHESEAFRQSTMRLLRMQLGSIICMDIIAFGGAAAGVILALQAYASSSVSIAGALQIILLSAEFFIPLRQLGSLFHVSMNGAAASRKVFAILDSATPPNGTLTIPDGKIQIEITGLSFAYNTERTVLSDITLTLAPGRLVSLVGASGSGKSTIAALLSGSLQGYCGSVKLAGIELCQLSQESIRKRVALVTHDAYVFAGSVEDNLRLAKPDASLTELQTVLETVCLSAELSLDTSIKERGANLSGGQRQRLCIARALLLDADFYLFDEAASNIDIESENNIMNAIHQLAKKKTVLLISHRLANVVSSSCIYLFQNGKIVQSGTHSELLQTGGAYRQLWTKQHALEEFSAYQARSDVQCA